MIKATFVGITKEKEYPKEIDTSEFDEVLIKTESPSVYERYILASKARNEIVYVQDDDCTIDYKALFEHYNGQITNGITQHHYDWYKDKNVTLVGWGCFFPKIMLKNIGKYASKYGVDAHLLREADRIFTYLNQPFNSVIMGHVDFSEQTGRMWNESNHWTSMAEAIEKCKTLDMV
jgi:hypothetical protein